MDGPNGGPSHLPQGVELIKQFDSIRPLCSAPAPPPHLLRSMNVLYRGGGWACRLVLQHFAIDLDPRTGHEVIKEMVRGRSKAGPPFFFSFQD